MQKKKLIYLLLACSMFLQASLAAQAKTNYKLPSLEEIQTINKDLKVDALIEKLPVTAHSDDPLLKLVNKNNPNADKKEPELAWDSYGNIYHQDLVKPLEDLMEAAAKDGFYYRVVSGYRSVEEQENNRNLSIQNYLAEGLSQADAESVTNQYFAPADASEHTTGLAIDLLGTEWLDNGGELEASYSETDSAKWLANNAHRFGFILRYQQNKESITGYNFEPWHFRYVGKVHAGFIYENGLTLEEYLALLAKKESN